MSEQARLVLDDGTEFEGQAVGRPGMVVGDVVCPTGMTGYQEALTQPACRGQIVVFTAPHLGNVGVNDADAESPRVWAGGVVARAMSPRPSNYRATGDLPSLLDREGVPGIVGVDTRAIARAVRDGRVQRAGIFSGDLPTDAPLLELVRTGAPEQQRAVSLTPIEEQRPVAEHQGPGIPLAVVDLGVAASTLRAAAAAGFDPIRMPARSIGEDLTDYAAVLIGDGPGDPAEYGMQVHQLRKLVEAKVPLVGIGLGGLLVGRALGFGTERLGQGQHGANIPVRAIQSGNVAVTDQWRSFGLRKAEGARADVTHVGLNDEGIAGVMGTDAPALALLYRPNAASARLGDPFAQLYTWASKGSVSQ